MNCAVFVFASTIAAASAGLSSDQGRSYAGTLQHAYGSVAHSGYATGPSLHRGFAGPGVQSGYVAATPGSYHSAPLPEGPHAFSHHINTAPAPGTYY